MLQTVLVVDPLQLSNKFAFQRIDSFIDLCLAQGLVLFVTKLRDVS